MNVLVLGREDHLVYASTTILEAAGFTVVGVTRDEEAQSHLATGKYTALVIGSGVEHISRGPLKQGAAPHGTTVIEARRFGMQSVQDNVREVIIPQLRLLDHA